ncbi:hypothetical protein KAR91_62645 [Candidatus Pacearchaeota archaeon]|nr:hypothetical protein [Candidatus Pacearchaeota archaeon]
MAGTLITKAESDKIKKANSPMVLKASRLVIKTTTGEDNAYEALKVIKERLKFIEGKRTKITKPLNASLREVNALFKELTQPLKDADDIIRGKVLGFREQQRLIAEKEEAKRHKLQAAHKAKGHKVHAPAVVEAVVGKSTTQKRWTFEVLDITKVPEMYLVVDSAEVNDAIADGERKIPGLRIYQKESLSVRGG